MNEELTREVLEAMKMCKRNCPSCGAIEVCSKHDWQEMMQTLATTLLEERAKPKVWDGAPDNAFRGIVNWYDKGRGFIESKIITREIPKTRTRQMAEEIVHGIRVRSPRPSAAVDIEYVEGVLTKYAEELTKKETD